MVLTKHHGQSSWSLMQENRHVLLAISRTTAERCLRQGSSNEFADPHAQVCAVTSLPVAGLGIPDRTGHMPIADDLKREVDDEIQTVCDPNTVGNIAVVVIDKASVTHSGGAKVDHGQLVFGNPRRRAEVHGSQYCQSPTQRVPGKVDLAMVTMFAAQSAHITADPVPQRQVGVIESRVHSSPTGRNTSRAHQTEAEVDDPVTESPIVILRAPEGDNDRLSDRVVTGMGAYEMPAVELDAVNLEVFHVLVLAAIFAAPFSQQPSIAQVSQRAVLHQRGG